MNESDRTHLADIILKFQHEANIAELQLFAHAFKLPIAEGDEATHRVMHTMYTVCVAALVAKLESSFEGEGIDTLPDTVKTSLASMKVQMPEVSKDLQTRLN